MNGYIIALDQGTTSSRSIIFDSKGNIVSLAQYPFTQIYPKPRPARPRTRQHLLYVKNRVFLSYHNLHRKSKPHARQILYLIYIIIIYIIVEIIMNFCYTDRADTGASAQ